MLSLSPKHLQQPTTRRLYQVLVVLSLLILATLYIRTIRLELPYRYIVDEDYFYVSAMNIRNTGQQFNMLYPPLSPYLTSLISLIMDAASGGTQYAGVAATSIPTYIAGRLSSAFFMLMACAVLYAIGKRLYSPAAGLVMLWLFGSDPQVFAFSYQIRGDAASYLFMAISLYFSLRGLTNPNNARARWISTGSLFIGILGKYTIAPLAVFPAYLWLRRYIPSVRHQLILIFGVIVSVVIGITALRTFGNTFKSSFEHAGFLFLFSDQLFSTAKLGASLNELILNLSPWFLASSSLLLLYILSQWRRLNSEHRHLYRLALILLAGLSIIMSMQVMRYRDIFVIPFVLYVGWGFALAFLLGNAGRTGQVILLVAGLVIAFPAFYHNWNDSNIMRIGDTRTLVSHWLETNVQKPSKIVKEYTVGDYLPHANGYLGGDQSWTITRSILDKPVDQWWADGNLYAITDSRQVTHSWFDPATDKSLYRGYTLAYQTPDNFPGTGPAVAVFYTFEIHRPANVYWNDLAQIFGYNVDIQTVCSGAQLPLRVFIRALHKTDIYYETVVSMIDPNTRQIVYSHHQAPGLDQRPTTVWDQYELIFDDHWLSIPATLNAGTYELRLSLFEPYHKIDIPVYDKQHQPLGNNLSLGTIQVNTCSAYRGLPAIN